MKETKPILHLAAAHLVLDTYSPVLPAILPLLIIENGYPYLVAGLIVTVWNLTSSFTQPLVGWLYDRRGLSIQISTSILLASVFISAIGITSNYFLILLFAALAALGHAFFHPAALGTVSRLATDHARGRLTSYFVVGGNLGFAVGPLIAGLVVGLFGLRGIVLLAIPGLITVIVLKKILPGPGLSPYDKDVSRKSHPAGKRVSRGAVGLLVIASALRAWAIFASVAYLPTFLTERSFDVLTANMLVSVMLVAGVIGQVVGGTLSDRYGRKEYTLFGLICAVPPFLLFLSSEGLVAIIAIIAFGFFLWSTFSVTIAMGHEMMPGDVGLVSGLMLGLAVGAGGAGVAVIGYLADIFSLEIALSFIIVPIITAFLLFLVLPYPWKILGRRAGDRTDV